MPDHADHKLEIVTAVPDSAMVVFAHPDDAEIGSGGVIATWVAAGCDVTYVLCTNGEAGTADRDLTPDALARKREREQRHDHHDDAGQPRSGGKTVNGHDGCNQHDPEGEEPVIGHAADRQSQDDVDHVGAADDDRPVARDGQRHFRFGDDSPENLARAGKVVDQAGRLAGHRDQLVQPVLLDGRQ